MSESQWVKDNELRLYRAGRLRYQPTTYQDQMGYWAVEDKAADKYATRRSIDRDEVERRAEELNRRWLKRMAKTAAHEYQNPYRVRSSRNPEWQVVVGNVGTVYSGTNGAEARKTFLVYRKQSRTGQGRAAGEEVTLFKDGEPVESYWGAQRNPTPSIIGFGRGYVVYPHGIYKKYLRDAKKAAQELADKSGEMARVEREYTNETVFKAYPRPINPSRAPVGAVKAQIRRLPTGEVQIRIPLKSRNPASLQSAMQVVRNLGGQVKKVALSYDGRVPNPWQLDTVAARELELFIENDAGLYRQQYTPIIKNLATKRARGIYDHDKAVKLFMYLMESGAKKYAKEYGGPGAKWHEMFNVPTRRAVAERFARSFETEYDLGNYDHLLPKKYQKVR